jgi:RNA polymerase sigma-70 factor (ECF subfamily)
MDAMNAARPTPRDDFATTHWSLVLAAGGRPSEPGPHAALSELCQSYWPPVYAYVRRRTASVESAQDLTQEFFLKLLEKAALATVSPARGRFRAFLLTSVKNFLANQRQREHAQKRGAGRAPLSLDWHNVESRVHLEPADDLTAERRFERDWAMTLLDRVLDRLREKFSAAGKVQQFEALKATLTGSATQGAYEKIAAELNCSPESARQAARRLKMRYRELLRDEVAHTVADRGEVDDEIRRLFETFSDS